MKMAMVVLMVILFLAAGICSAHPPWDGAGKPQGGRSPEEIPMLLMKLPDLTAEQKTALGTIFRAEREQQNAQMIKRVELRKQLRTAEEVMPVDEAAIRKIATALGELEAEHIASRALVRAKVNSLLTPVQRALLTIQEPPPPRDHPGCPDRGGCIPPPPPEGFMSGQYPE